MMKLFLLTFALVFAVVKCDDEVLKKKCPEECVALLNVKDKETKKQYDALVAKACQSQRRLGQAVYSSCTYGFKAVSKDACVKSCLYKVSGNSLINKIDTKITKICKERGRNDRNLLKGCEHGFKVSLNEYGSLGSSVRDVILEECTADNLINDDDVVVEEVEARRLGADAKAKAEAEAKAKAEAEAKAKAKAEAEAKAKAKAEADAKAKAKTEADAKAKEEAEEAKAAAAKAVAAAKAAAEAEATRLRSEKSEKEDDDNTVSV